MGCFTTVGFREACKLDGHLVQPLLKVAEPKLTRQGLNRIYADINLFFS